MCGIAGFSGRFDGSLLARMSRTIHYRGPDDEGEYLARDAGIGLAHRRLSIIDLSPQGHQPMWDDTGTAVIVFNGEIFNYRELRRDLEARGFVFRSTSDTEVLLNLYLRDGVEMLGHLNGMYAFALYDTRTSRLFLARDPIGVKPLYHCLTPSGFLFASELKALLADPGVDRALDPEAIQHYLTYLWCPAPRTMLQSVRKLPPGHALTVRKGRIERIWRFYDLPYDRPLERLPVDGAIEELRRHLGQAVKRQMVADVPVGAFLSGGLDSSSVVALARQCPPDRKLQCFTIGFDDPVSRREGLCEDLPYAQRVARQLDVDLHTITVGPEMAAKLEEMIYHLDEPQADPAAINVLFISQLAREHGIKVLLSGAGGDDLLTGYRRHYALMQEGYWAWMPRPARRALRALAERLPVRHPLPRRIAKAFQYADRDGLERIAGYFSWIDPRALHRLYGPLLRDPLDQADPLRVLVESAENLPRGVHPLNQMLYLEGKHFLADHNLNYTDKMSMARGVEVRVPLLDPDLVAFAARLPIAYKQRGRIGKWIFKRAMESTLPRDVIYRPKTGFGAPLRHWLRHPLRPLVEDVLSASALKARGLFEPAGVGALVEADRAGRIDAAYTVLALMCIELWCRRFIDGTSNKGTP